MKKTIIVFLILASAVLLAGCTSSDEDYNRLNMGDPIPSFTVDGVQGSNPVTISSGDFAGKQGLIVFFSSTCSDCHRELPKVDAAWRVLKDDPQVSVAVISRGGTPEAIAAYWEEAGFIMPYYFDPERAVYDQFSKAGVPKIYLIDRSGAIRHIFSEELPLDAQGLVDLVKSME